jgi:hypothetical protein
MMLSPHVTLRHLALAALLMLAGASTAGAQIVNVQGALAQPPSDDGVKGQIEARVDWRTGNTPLFDVGGAVNVLVRRGRVLGLAILRAEYGRGLDSTFKRRTFEHVRARVTLDCRWRWEAFAQHELDGFRRLTVRALAGSGPALQIVDHERVGILGGLSYFLEYEQFDRREGAIDAGARMLQHRASFYVTSTQKLTDSVALVQTGYVQPRIDEPGDVRLLGELSVTSKLTKHVAITNGFIGSYDRTPPAEIRRYDTQLRFTVLITL